MNNLRIRFPKNHHGITLSDGVVVEHDGKPIDLIRSMTIVLEPGNAVAAEVTMDLLPTIEGDVWAQPWMSEESFLAAAERYGYTVTKKNHD